jgi:hypothetical protein
MKTTEIGIADPNLPKQDSIITVLLHFVIRNTVHILNFPNHPFSDFGYFIFQLQLNVFNMTIRHPKKT